MTCCILAALLLAHMMAVLRRWGMFWGVVQVPVGVEFDTAYQRLRRWLARPQVRKVVVGLFLFEAMTFSGWAYAAHGQHIYQAGDQAIGWLRGQTIVYAEVCGDKARETVRLVIGQSRRHVENVV